jgi:hypothetical protein
MAVAGSHRIHPVFVELAEAADSLADAGAVEPLGTGQTAP